MKSFKVSHSKLQKAVEWYTCGNPSSSSGKTAIRNFLPFANSVSLEGCEGEVYLISKTNLPAVFLICVVQERISVRCH